MRPDRSTGSALRRILSWRYCKRQLSCSPMRARGAAETSAGRSAVRFARDVVTVGRDETCVIQHWCTQLHQRVHSRDCQM